MQKKPFSPEADPARMNDPRSVSDLDKVAANLLTDIAIVGNVSSSRLFSTYPVAVAWDLQREAMRKWEEAHRLSPLE